jgi:hypothetical protein
VPLSSKRVSSWSAPGRLTSLPVGQGNWSAAATWGAGPRPAPSWLSIFHAAPVLPWCQAPARRDRRPCSTAPPCTVRASGTAANPCTASEPSIVQADYRTTARYLLYRSRGDETQRLGAAFAAVSPTPCCKRTASRRPPRTRYSLPRENTPTGREPPVNRVRAARDGTRCQSGRVAMQKVEGSSPFIRLAKGPGNGAFLLPQTNMARRLQPTLQPGCLRSLGLAELWCIHGSPRFLSRRAPS